VGCWAAVAVNLLVSARFAVAVAVADADPVLVVVKVMSW
jgi:hypothetical protein